MNTSLKIISLLFSFFLACKSDQKDGKVDNKNNLMNDPDIYEDIDPFTLTGVNKIKESSVYPHIRIEEGKNKKRIIYVITRTDSAENIYEMNAGGWTTSYLNKIDTGSEKTYEYILPGRIIELTYLGTYDETGFYLFKASVMKGDTITTYFTADGQKPLIDPDPGIIDSVKDRIPIIITEKMELQADVLRTTVSHFNKKEKKITYTDTACFSGGKRSWFWFRHFMGQLIPCR